MRNLKRALSLGLTAAMISGLMITGASAASYNDSESIQNQTAVEILGEIGAMIGDDQGNFNPDQDVTRAEMAVIITRILYGNDLNVDQFKGMNIFSDVPSWAEGFVNLCASLNIVAGVGGDKFDPNATVTTAQAALMLTRALGYFQNNAEFGNDWALSAVRRATQVGIIGGDMVLQANEGLSRDDVAQMTFNTLTKAVPVQYNELLNVYYNENQGITYSLTFYYTDTLGYTNFDLVYRSNDRGDYGRPSTTWGIGYYMGGSGTETSGNDDYDLNEDGSLKPERVRMLEEDEIITVAEEPTYVYTESTKQNVVYKDLGRSLVEDTSWDWEAYVDGEEQLPAVLPENTKDSSYLYTSDGATTEVYVDAVNEEVTIVKINYYMGEVTDIREDEDGEYATVRVLSQDTNETVGGLSDVVKIRDIYCEGFAEDDYVMITVDVNDDGDSYVKTIEYPETVEGVVSHVDMDSEPEEEKGGYVRLADDDTKYEYSAWTASDLDDINEIHPTLDASYRLYLDANGFVLGFIATENIYDNYLYIEEASEYLGTIEALATFADGVSQRITIDDEWVNGVDIDKDLVNLAYTAGGLEGGAYAYTVSNDVYTLRQVKYYGVDRDAAGTMFKNYRDVAENVTAGADVQIKNDVAYITVNGEKYIVDKNTQFVDVEEGTAYVGYENVPDYITEDGNVVEFWVIDTRETNGVLDVVFIYNGESSNDNKTYFYVPDATDYESYDRDGMYKGLVCYIDGEDASLDFTAAAFDEVRTNKVGLYVVNRTNADGYVTDCDYLGDGTEPNGIFYDVKAVGDSSFSLMDGDKTKQWTTNDETLFVTVTYDLKKNSYSYETADVTVGKLNDMKQNETYDINAYVAKPSDSDDPAELVYIVREELIALDNTITFTGDTADYTVTNIDVDDGYVSGAYTIEVNDGEDVTFTIKPADGKTITSVTGADLVSGNTYRITDIQTDVTVNVQIDEIKDMYTLTLKGSDLALAAATQPVNVYATPVGGTESRISVDEIDDTSDGATVTYKIPEGADVIITGVAEAKITSDMTFQVGNTMVNAVEVATGADRLTFTMSENLTLEFTAADEINGLNNIYAITTHNGVKGSYTVSGETKPLNDGVTYVPITATLTITDVGEGEKVITKVMDTVANAKDVGDTIGSLSGNVDLYSAAKITVNNTNIDVNVDATNKVVQGTSQYVAVGVNVTVDVKAAAAFDYAVVSTDANVKHGANVAGSGFTVEGNKPYTVYGAYELKLDDVVATYGTPTQTIDENTYVAHGTSLNLAPVKDMGTKVLEKDADLGIQYGTDVSSSAQTMDADAEYLAAVTVKLVTKDTKLAYYDENRAGEVTILTATSGNETLVVETGAKLIVNGTTTSAGLELTLDNATDATVQKSLKSEGAAGSISAAKLEFTLGYKDADVTEA